MGLTCRKANLLTFDKELHLLIFYLETPVAAVSQVPLKEGLQASSFRNPVPSENLTVCIREVRTWVRGGQGPGHERRQPLH